MNSRSDLEEETPPIHRPLYKLSPLELTEAKNQIQEMLEHEFIRPSRFPLWRPYVIRTQERQQPSVLH